METTQTSRAEAIDLVAAGLLAHAARLTRVLYRTGSRELTRTEAGMLRTLLERPHRITELAETETMAQPSVTQIVDRLERRGLVTRGKSPTDGRVVLVTITEAGREQFDAVREEFRGRMRGAVQELDDGALADLVTATETLSRLVEALAQPAVPA